MLTLHAYLTFNGNCREAMTFYKRCLGGKLILDSLKNSSFSTGMPQKMKNCIHQATLIKGNLLLMATDLVQDEGLVKGNSISLVLSCSSLREFKSIYTKLSPKTQRPPQFQQKTDGSFFGTVADKYHNQWLLVYSSKRSKKK